MSGRPYRQGFNKDNVTFHLREVSTCRLSYYKDSLWLFGNTAERYSVAIQIYDFYPYFYIDIDQIQIDNLDQWVDDLKSDLEDNNQKWTQTIIRYYEVTLKSTLIGFCERPKQFLKIFYESPSKIFKIRKYFKEHTNIRLYHDDWGIETLFLNETGVQLQTWVKVNNLQDRPDRDSTCSVEKKASWRNISQTKEEIVSIPPVLCCAIRIRAFCSIATANNPMLPSADIANDRVLYISTSVFWMGEEKTNTKHFEDLDESKMILDFSQYIRNLDVDCFVYLSDNCNPLNYISQRNEDVGLSKFPAVPFTKLKYGKDNTTYKILHPGRSRMDIKYALQKSMLDPPLDCFTLKDAVQHAVLCKDPPPNEMLSFSYIYSSFLSSERIQYETDMEVFYLQKLEHNNFMLLGFIEISSASFTSLISTIENGQQSRVWGKFRNSFHKDGLIVNKEKLDQPLLIVNKPNSLSTLPDPIYREDNSTNSKHDTKQRDLQGKSVILEEKKVQTETKGGFVCTPVAGFYCKSEERTITMDFASLYPNIIQGYNICYRALLFKDQQHILADERYEKLYLSINPTQCQVVIKTKKTIIPKIIAEVMEERKRTRRQMVTITDKHMLRVLNAKQLSCKVFQNAVYGFFGVEKYGILPCPVIMLIICRIGQYMIKTVREYLIHEHKGRIVYGGTCLLFLFCVFFLLLLMYNVLFVDTDSVMVQFPCPVELQNESEKIRYLYQLGFKLEEECSCLFPKPNKFT